MRKEVTKLLSAIIAIAVLIVLTSSASVIADASPTINSIVPPSVSAGTNSEVTIYGSGFGIWV